MNRYQITNTTSGKILGTYEAADEAGAWAACAADAGDRDAEMGADIEIRRESPCPLYDELVRLGVSDSMTVTEADAVGAATIDDCSGACGVGRYDASDLLEALRDLPDGAGWDAVCDVLRERLETVA
jgi:hypothetical protein